MKTQIQREELTQIADLVIKNYKVDIRANKRDNEYIHGRWLYAKLAMEFTPYSLALIGGELGKDHASVLNYKRRIENPNYFNKQLEFLYTLYKVELLETYPMMLEYKKLMNNELTDIVINTGPEAIIQFYEKKLRNKDEAFKQIKKTKLRLKIKNETMSNLLAEKTKELEELKKLFDKLPEQYKLKD